MSKQPPLAFGAKEKLRWLEVIALHPDTIAFDTALGLALTNRVNPHTGLAVVGQEWLGKFAGGRPRTVRDSTTRLRNLAFMDIEVARGRTHANTYKLRTITDEEYGRMLASIKEDNRRIPALKLADFSTKTGGDSPPLPDTHLNSSYPVPQAVTPQGEAWDAVKKGLAADLGDDVTRSWFADLQVEEITDQAVTMFTPSKFGRKKINNEYSDHLLRAWQRHCPSITAVHVRNPLARAAE